MYTAAAKSGHYEIADVSKGPVGPEEVLTARGAAGVIFRRRTVGAAQPIVLWLLPSAPVAHAVPDIRQSYPSERA
jgi:hypothetical protein